MSWGRWIRPGLAITLILAAIALFIRGGAIHRDLDVRVDETLQAQGLNWVDAETDWRDVVITGIAPSEAAQELAADLARRTAGVRSVTDRTRLLPEQTPYTWSGLRTGSAVEIVGYVPSEGARSSILAEARRAFPTAEIREDLGLARGAPEAFGPAVAFALDRLAELAEGQVMLSDATLSVSGTALNSQSFLDARDALAGSVPVGTVLGPVEILPPRAPRFVWSAAVSEEGVALAGFIPNNAMRDIIADQAREAFPERTVDDRTVVASGEPDGFLDAVRFAVDALTHLDGGGVTLDELTLDIAGTARSVDSYEALLANIGERLPADMDVVAADLVPATVDDYGWRGEVSADGVVLTGYVPSLADQRRLAETAERLFGGGGKLANEVRIARGGPAIDWFGGVQFALAQLSRLATGTVEITGEAVYAIRGTARTSEDYAIVSGEAEGTLPASLALAERAVEPPPAEAYVAAAERNGGSLALSGFVPDRQRHADLLTFVARIVPGAVIDDATAYGSGVPPGFLEAVEVGVRGLAYLTGGRMEIGDGRLSLSGFADGLATAREAVAVVEERLPDGYDLAVDVSVRQPPQPLDAEACGEALKTLLATGRLEFDGDGAEVAADSRPVLGRLAATLARCPETLVEIGVHSDSDGSRSRNRTRTQARADTLLEVLVGSAIRRERLTAVGYGEDNPIAGNDTDEGKARNRRIEFALAVPETVPPPVLPAPAPPEPDPPESGSFGPAAQPVADDAADDVPAEAPPAGPAPESGSSPETPTVGDGAADESGDVGGGTEPADDAGTDTTGESLSR